MLKIKRWGTISKSNALEGKDTYIDVKVKKRIRVAFRRLRKSEEDKDWVSFFLEINVTAKQSGFVQCRFASGKNGWFYVSD